MIFTGTLLAGLTLLSGYCITPIKKGQCNYNNSIDFHSLYEKNKPETFNCETIYYDAWVLGVGSPIVGENMICSYYSKRGREYHRTEVNYVNIENFQSIQLIGGLHSTEIIKG